MSKKNRNDNRKKSVLEIDKICRQANTLAGLTHVISMYFTNMKEDEVLQNVFTHLHDIAFEHKNDCNEFFDNSDVD